MSNKKVLLLALICGLLTALAVNYYLKSIKEAALNIKTKNVVMANMKIPSRTIVTVNMLSIKKIPVEYVHPSAIVNASDVIGHTTLSDIDAGEQVLKTKLIPKENNGKTFSHTIPLGMRAVSIELKDAPGVSYLLTPGDHVDVLGLAVIEITSPDPSVNTIKEVKTHLIMENARILAVRTAFPSSQSGTEEKKDNASTLKTVTLAVPPEKMQLIVHMAGKDSLYLALRAPADNSEQARQPMDEKELLR